MRNCGLGASWTLQGKAISAQSQAWPQTPPPTEARTNKRSGKNFANCIDLSTKDFQIGIDITPEMSIISIVRNS